MLISGIRQAISLLIGAIIAAFLLEMGLNSISKTLFSCYEKSDILGFSTRFWHQTSKNMLRTVTKKPDLRGLISKLKKS